jgi:hypothetical protein
MVSLFGDCGLTVQPIVPFGTVWVRGVYCSVSPAIRLLFAMLLEAFLVAFATFLVVL